MSNRQVAIRPFTAEFNAWLAYHRGTKTEARMLACLGSRKPRRAMRSWLAPSKFPPEAPRAENLTSRRDEQTARVSFHDHGNYDQVSEVAARLEEKAARGKVDATEQKKRRKLARTAERLREDAIAAVACNGFPNVADSSTLGTIKVSDPMEADRLVFVGKGPPMRISNPYAILRARLIELRDDPIGDMAKRRHLGDDPDQALLRLAAARLWQKIYEHAELSNLRGIDPAHEFVDGGPGVVDIAPGRLDAINRLGQLSRVLGMQGENLLRRVLGEKRTLKEFAEMNGRAADKTLIFHYGESLREYLDMLVSVFGLVAVGVSPRRISDKYAAASAALARSMQDHRAFVALGAEFIGEYTAKHNAGKPLLRFSSGAVQVVA